MDLAEHIQAAVDPDLLRSGRPLVPPSTLDRPRTRRLHGINIPALTRQIPTVEAAAGAVLGMGVGIVLGFFRTGIADAGWTVIFCTVFGLLLGWLIGTFTGATGTLSVRTVLANMLHIIIVVGVVAIFVAIVGFIAAILGAAYGPDRNELNY
jgi:uncharacterized membrane protein